MARTGKLNSLRSLPTAPLDDVPVGENPLAYKQNQDEAGGEFELDDGLVIQEAVGQETSGGSGLLSEFAASGVDDFDPFATTTQSFEDDSDDLDAPVVSANQQEVASQGEDDLISKFDDSDFKLENEEPEVDQAPVYSEPTEEPQIKVVGRRAQKQQSEEVDEGNSFDSRFGDNYESVNDFDSFASPSVESKEEEPKESFTYSNYIPIVWRGKGREPEKLPDIRSHMIEVLSKIILNKAAEEYESEIFTRSFTKRIIDLYMNGQKHDSKMFVSLISEMREANFQVDFLGEETENVLLFLEKTEGKYNVLS